MRLIIMDESSARQTERGRTCGIVFIVGVLVLGWASTIGKSKTLPNVAIAESQEVETPQAYAPFAFLIGEWDVAVEDGKAAAVSRCRWGPGKTYMWYSGALLVNGGETPAWEGMLVWNGVHKRLDFILVLEPTAGHLAQEQGSIHVAPDGSLVREITAYYSEGNPAPPTWAPAGPNGATAQYRHTFKPEGPNRIRASVFRETADGWVPNFPGSDRLVMTRRVKR